MTFASSARPSSQTSKRSSLLPSLKQVRAERARRSLAQFVRWGWEIVEPETELIWNWHIDAICQHLEAVTRQQLWRPDEPEPEGGRIQRLVINQPPGTMKSLISSVFWPAWEWIEHGHIKSLYSSYALDLAIRDSIRCRDLLTSGWYQESFDPQWELKGDQNIKSWYATTAGGVRQCLSVGSKATGFRGHKVVCDDPLNASDAYSEAMRTRSNTWWSRTMSSRLNDPRTGARVLIQQRVHEEDTSGDVLAKGQYDHLCLPAEFDPHRRTTTSIGWTDPRTEEGELLFPELFTAKVLSDAKKDLGSADYSGQYNQRPAPATGLIFQRSWWRYWKPKGVNLPPVEVRDDQGEIHRYLAIDLPDELDIVVNSWDMTFKATTSSDFVAGGIWGRKGSRAFLLDQVCDRLAFPATCAAVRELRARDSRVSAIFVEDKANGPAVIATLEQEIPGLIAVEPDGGKLARAHAVSPYAEAGNVFVPHPALMDWVDGYLDEVTSFPLGAHDDQVDQTTQALRRLLLGIEERIMPTGIEPVNPALVDYQPLGGMPSAYTPLS